jgi:hypothetical protein
MRLDDMPMNSAESTKMSEMQAEFMENVLKRHEEDTALRRRAVPRSDSMYRVPALFRPQLRN